MPISLPPSLPPSFSPPQVGIDLLPIGVQFHTVIPCWHRQGLRVVGSRLGAVQWEILLMLRMARLQPSWPGRAGWGRGLCASLQARNHCPVCDSQVGWEVDTVPRPGTGPLAPWEGPLTTCSGSRYCLSVLISSSKGQEGDWSLCGRHIITLLDQANCWIWLDMWQNNIRKTLTYSTYYFFIILKIFILFYLLDCIRSWLGHTRSLSFIVACGIFSFGMQDLVLWPGIKLESPALWVRSLSHWMTREVPQHIVKLPPLTLLSVSVADSPEVSSSEWVQSCKKKNKGKIRLKPPRSGGPGILTAETGSCSVSSSSI